MARQGGAGAGSKGWLPLLAPHLPSLQGVPKESVEPLWKCASGAPTRLAVLSVVPALPCRVLLFTEVSNSGCS